MIDAAGDVLAVTDSYEGLVQACVVRRNELRMSQLAADEISGLPSGYVAKLEVGMKRMGALSLTLLLQTLGLQLVVVRIEPHHRRQQRIAPMSSRGQTQDAEPGQTHAPIAA